MTDFNPVFRSPITSSSSPAASSSNLTLADLTGVTISLIQGAAADALQPYFSSVPDMPGDLVDVGGGLLACLTPSQFYLFGMSRDAKLPIAAELNGSLAKEQRFAHAIDYTHGKAVLRLGGAAAPEVLSKICGLDFHDTVFPNMRVAQTSAAKIKTLIARFDQAKTTTYYLHVDRPLGQYFWEVINDAGQEFGLTTSGS